MQKAMRATTGHVDLDCSQNLPTMPINVPPYLANSVFSVLQVAVRHDCLHLGHLHGHYDSSGR